MHKIKEIVLQIIIIVQCYKEGSYYYMKMIAVIAIISRDYKVMISVVTAIQINKIMY